MDNPDNSCKAAAGRPKAAEVEARTQELLQTAAALFLKNGYTKTSLESIARAAHVAVRTIYVKFGGKAGLLHAVLADKRHRFFRSQPMQTDTRPLKEIVDEFARNMYELLTSQEAIDMQRIVLAEAPPVRNWPKPSGTAVRARPARCSPAFSRGPTSAPSCAKTSNSTCCRAI